MKVTGTPFLGGTTYEQINVYKNETEDNWELIYFTFFINIKDIYLHITSLQTKNPFLPSLSSLLFRVLKQHA